MRTGGGGPGGFLKELLAIGCLGYGLSFLVLRMHPMSWVGVSDKGLDRKGSMFLFFLVG